MFDDACHSWTEMLLCHSIGISISLERLFQSSSFFHHCKCKSFVLFVCLFVCLFFTHPVLFSNIYSIYLLRCALFQWFDSVRVLFNCFIVTHINTMISGIGPALDIIKNIFPLLN